MIPVHSNFKILTTCLLLGLLSFILYFPSLDSGFINYDDGRVLTDHPELYNQPHLTDGLNAIVFEYFPREEPLVVRDISWAIDSRVFGFNNPAGYHFVNVMLHGIVVILLFLFLMLTTARYDFALSAVLAFLALAVHVEPVAWIMGRKDILVTLFGLLALIAQCKMLLSSQRAVKYCWYVCSIFATLLALFSKINAVVFPGVLFLHFVLFRHLRNESAPEGPVSRKLILNRALPCIVPHLLASLLVYKWYHGILASYGILDRNYSANLPEHLWNLVRIDPMVLLRYLRLMFLPRHLSLFYTWPDLTSDFHWHHILASIGLLSFLAIIGVYFAARRKDLLFYYLSFFVLMVPYLNIVYFGIWIANRYLYFSSFCVIAIAVDPALQLFKRSRLPTRTAIAALAVVFVSGNLIQKYGYQRAWKNSEDLWSYELGLPDTRIYAFDNLASFYYSEARVAKNRTEQEKLLQKAETIIDRGTTRFRPHRDSRDPAELFHLFFLKALIAQIRGEPPAMQLAALEKAEMLNPRFDAVLFEMAVFYYRQALKTEGETRENWARGSMKYFSKYVRHSLKDHATIKKIKDMEKMYARDFPFIAKEAEDAVDLL